MAEWGRAVDEADAAGATGGRRAGLASMVLAAGAFVVAVAVAVVIATSPQSSTELLHDGLAGSLLFAFLFLTPVLHVAGMICGVVAIAAGWRGGGALGLLLNVVLMLAGSFLAYAAMGGA
jgi:hypothetical protein